jgi:hypothetical protein
MAPKKEKSTQVSTPPPAASPQGTPIWKKPWLWFAGSVAALALLLSNVNSILSNARVLPGEVQKTSDQFFEWYGDYEAWKGQWTNNPEGFVDMAELNLSSEDFRVNIDETAGGRIGGTIETKGICEKTPIFEELLIDGSISSARKATIEAFDFIGGYRRNFAKLTLRRDGYVMTVIPVDDPSGLFAKKTRIAHYPDEFKLGDDADLGEKPICAGKRAKFFTDLVEKIQKQRDAGKVAK